MVLKSKNWIIVILVSFTKIAQMITISKKTTMENVGGIYLTKKSQKAVQIEQMLNWRYILLALMILVGMNIIFLNLKEEWIVVG